MSAPPRWTQEEVDDLISLHRIYGSNWSVVSAKMKTDRNRGACCCKWHYLTNGRQSKSGSGAAARKMQARAALGRDSDQDDSEYDELESTDDESEQVVSRPRKRARTLRSSVKQEKNPIAQAPAPAAVDFPAVPVPAPKPVNFRDVAVQNFASSVASLGRILERCRRSQLAPTPPNAAARPPETRALPPSPPVPATSVLASLFNMPPKAQLWTEKDVEQLNTLWSQLGNWEAVSGQLQPEQGGRRSVNACYTKYQRLQGKRQSTRGAPKKPSSATKKKTMLNRKAATESRERVKKAQAEAADFFVDVEQSSGEVGEHCTPAKKKQKSAPATRSAAKNTPVATPAAPNDLADDAPNSVPAGVAREEAVVNFAKGQASLGRILERVG